MRGGALERVWVFSHLVTLVLLVSLICFRVVIGDAGVDTSDRSWTDHLVHLSREIERLKGQVLRLEMCMKEQDGGLQRKNAYIRVLSKLDPEVSKISKVKQIEDKGLSEAHEYTEALRKHVSEADESMRTVEAHCEMSQTSCKTCVQNDENRVKFAKATTAGTQKKAYVSGEKLFQVLRQWSFPWAEAHFAVFKEKAKLRWSSHYGSHVYGFCKGAEAANTYLKHHFNSVRRTAGPKAQKQWNIISYSVAKSVRLLQSRTLKGYHVIKDNCGLHLEFLQVYSNIVTKSGRPYFTWIKERTRHYVDDFWTLSQPSLRHISDYLNPYLEKILPYRHGVVAATVMYNDNLQGAVRKGLSTDKVAVPVVSQELVWFLASAFLALPVFMALLVFSSAFNGTNRRPRRRFKSSGKQRRAEEAAE